MRPAAALSDRRCAGRDVALVGFAVGMVALGLTGLILIVLRYAPSRPDPFSVYPRASWPWVVGAHALAVPVAIFFVGAVWRGHVSKHWRFRRRRRSGLPVIAALALAAITGYALYFVGDEGWLAGVRAAHAAAGLALLLVYAIHAATARRRSTRLSIAAGPSAANATERHQREVVGFRRARRRG